MPCLRLGVRCAFPEMKGLYHPIHVDSNEMKRKVTLFSGNIHSMGCATDTSMSKREMARIFSSNWLPAVFTKVAPV
eukprot:scaffold1174_cov180-Amphora_coffeaeformis.AAC.2